MMWDKETRLVDKKVEIPSIFPAGGAVKYSLKCKKRPGFNNYPKV